MASSESKHLCLYCGEPTKRGKRGEHIVQNALGGELTLNDVPTSKVVCPTCNSGVLGRLDKELCSRSYLSVVASQQINAHLWQTWDVDHAADNLLVEARPVWADDGYLQSLVCHPQITFERAGPDVRADWEEAARFGNDAFGRVLFKAARRCFDRYRAGVKRALHLERIRLGSIYDGHRLPPRIFTTHSIAGVAENIHRKQSFTLRYANDEDLKFALHSLSNLEEDRKFKGWSYKPGSHRPTLAFYFDIGDTMRALMKIGVNLLAAYCRKTPVNHETFAQAIQIITGDDQIPWRVLAVNGFVHAEHIQPMRGADNEHTFRLLHMDGSWRVYFSFFGGRIGAFVRVPGPNNEDWTCANIVAPLGSKDWTFSPSRLLQPLKARVEWNNSKVITPSLKLQNSVSVVQADLVPRRRRSPSTAD